MIACISCGNFNDQAARVCRFCGNGLGPARQATEQREYVPPSSWVDEPTPVPMQPYGAPAPFGSYRCPRCGTTQPPIIQRTISQDGWIVFALLLFFCFPLFWIGLLMKQEHRICSMCHVDLG